MSVHAEGIVEVLQHSQQVRLSQLAQPADPHSQACERIRASFERLVVMPTNWAT